MHQKNLAFKLLIKRSNRIQFICLCCVDNCQLTTSRPLAHNCEHTNCCGLKIEIAYVGCLQYVFKTSNNVQKTFWKKLVSFSLWIQTVCYKRKYVDEYAVLGKPW